ncbi:MAG: hypothetical protein ACREBF_02340 [Candidatus Micrarchaeales archaeon]
MKIFVNSNKTVIVESGGKDNCPRAIISEGTMKFADDYYGEVRIRKSVLAKVVEL